MVWIDRPLEEARRTIFPQLVQRSVSGTTVRMTRDEDADRRGWFHPAKHAPASSQTAPSSGWRPSAMMEQEGLKGKRVQATALSTA